MKKLAKREAREAGDLEALTRQHNRAAAKKWRKARQRREQLAEAHRQREQQS